MCCPNPPPSDGNNGSSAVFTPSPLHQAQSANAVLLELAAALDSMSEGLRRVLLASDASRLAREQTMESDVEFKRSMEQQEREGEEMDRRLEEFQKRMADRKAAEEAERQSSLQVVGGQDELQADEASN